MRPAERRGVGVGLALGERRRRRRRRDRLPLLSSAWHGCHGPISAELNSLTGSWWASRRGGAGGERGWRLSALINELVVCRWYSAWLLPLPARLLQAPSSPFDMVMSPNWWRHFTHTLTTSTGEPHKPFPARAPLAPPPSTSITVRTLPSGRPVWPRRKVV